MTSASGKSGAKTNETVASQDRDESYINIIERYCKARRKSSE